MNGTQRAGERTWAISRSWVRMTRACCAGGLMVFVFAIVLFSMAGRTLSRGDSLVYVSRVGDQTQLYLLDVVHGARFKLYSVDEVRISDLAWSPDGRNLAFVSCTRLSALPESCDLCVIDEHRDVSILLRGGNLLDPTWSPDGSQIALARCAGEACDIFLVDLVNRTVRNLTNSDAIDRLPVWSPEGHTIAYVSGSDIFVLDVRSGGVRNLTSTPASVYSPAWSPDGRRIAFVSEPGGAHGLYVMNADGSDLYLVAERSDWRIWANSLAWSPDGTALAFIAVHGKHRQIFTVQPDGAELRSLLATTCDHCVEVVMNLAWSPDGQWIAFEGESANRRDIYMVEREGAIVYHLAMTDGDEVFPVWRP